MAWESERGVRHERLLQDAVCEARFQAGLSVKANTSDLKILSSKIQAALMHLRDATYSREEVKRMLSVRGFEWRDDKMEGRIDWWMEDASERLSSVEASASRLEERMNALEDAGRHSDDATAGRPSHGKAAGSSSDAKSGEYHHRTSTSTASRDDSSRSLQRGHQPSSRTSRAPHAVVKPPHPAGSQVAVPVEKTDKVEPDVSIAYTKMLQHQDEEVASAAAMRGVDVAEQRQQHRAHRIENKVRGVVSCEVVADPEARLQDLAAREEVENGAFEAVVEPVHVSEEWQQQQQQQEIAANLRKADVSPVVEEAHAKIDKLKSLPPMSKDDAARLASAKEQYLKRSTRLDEEDVLRRLEALSARVDAVEVLAKSQAAVRQMESMAGYVRELDTRLEQVAKQVVDLVGAQARKLQTLEAKVHEIQEHGETWAAEAKQFRQDLSRRQQHTELRLDDFQAALKQRGTPTARNDDVSALGELGALRAALADQKRDFDVERDTLLAELRRHQGLYRDMVAEFASVSEALPPITKEPRPPENSSRGHRRPLPTAFVQHVMPTTKVATATLLENLHLKEEDLLRRIQTTER